MQPGRRLFELRCGHGLLVLVAYRLPAGVWIGSTSRRWWRSGPSRASFMPRESNRLAGLQALVRRAVQARVAAVEMGPEVTLDVDPHLVELAKETALPTHDGFGGYQPLSMSWAETNLILTDEFWDGNVPAGKRSATPGRLATWPSASAHRRGLFKDGSTVRHYAVGDTDIHADGDIGGCGMRSRASERGRSRQFHPRNACTIAHCRLNCVARPLGLLRRQPGRHC